MKCKSCMHYGFYQMIQQPYGYSGVIPCLSCEEWLKPKSNYEPAPSPSDEIEKETGTIFTGTCPKCGSEVIGNRIRVKLEPYKTKKDEIGKEGISMLERREDVLLGKTKQVKECSNNRKTDSEIIEALTKDYTTLQDWHDTAKKDLAWQYEKIANLEAEVRILEKEKKEFAEGAYDYEKKYKIIEAELEKIETILKTTASWTDTTRIMAIKDIVGSALQDVRGRK